SVLGTVYGPVLLAGLLVRRRRPGFAARTLTWERRRLERFYRLRTTEVEPQAEPEAGSERDTTRVRPRAGHLLLYALGCMAAGLAMFQLLGLTIALVGGTTTQVLFSGVGSVVTIQFTTWQVHQPAGLVALLYVPASLAAVCLFSE